MKQLFRQIAVGLMVLSSLLVSVPALASAQEEHGADNGTKSGRPHMPGVFGTVSAINGTTLTLTSKGRGPNATSATTYTVDASSAAVIKNGATSTLSSVAVGDMVSAQGSVNGTNVTATKIRDGMGGGPGGMMGRGPRDESTQDTGAAIAGDGNPVIGGTITAVSGTTLTITNKSNVTYTVDASHATVVKGNSSSTVGAVAVGDMVLVQGAVSGNAVVASSVTDRGVPRAPELQATHTGDDNTSAQAHNDGGGFFGGIRNFFHNLFGFF